MIKPVPVSSGQLCEDEQLTMKAPFGRHEGCLEGMWKALDNRAVAHSTDVRQSSAVSRVLSPLHSPASRSLPAAVWVDPHPRDDRDPPRPLPSCGSMVSDSRR